MLTQLAGNPLLEQWQGWCSGWFCRLRIGYIGTRVKQDQHIERIFGNECDERFRGIQRLHSSEDFQRVRRRGRRVSGINLTLHYARQTSGSGGTSEREIPNRGGSLTLQYQSNEPGPTRIGFSVSKRVGGAVTRNLVKRRLREAARHRLAALASGWDLVLTAHPSAASVRYPVLVAELDELFARAGVWITQKSQGLLS